jgi:trehalose/maltose hydrolase-like predicted phosphorylase
MTHRGQSGSSRRSARSLAGVASAALVVTLVSALPAAQNLALAPAAAASAEPSGPWTFSTTDPTTDYSPTFIGNGYFSARVPAQGAGYSRTPLNTQAELAGFYADPPGETSSIEQRATLPMWTSLGFTAGTDSLGSLPVCLFDEACEAVNGELSGGAVVGDNHSGTTGGEFVQGLGQGATDTVPITQSSAGAAAVAIRYSEGNSGSRTISYSVNGDAAQQITLPSTGSWDSWATVSVPATLNAGTNTFAIAVGSADSGQVNLDTVAAYPVGSAVPSVDANVQQGSMSNYDQAIDMYTGTLTTSYAWTAPSGKVTDVTYTVNADQSDGHVGMVTLSFTPQWSGTATITDALDVRSLKYATASNTAVDDSSGTLTQTITTQGTNVSAALASVLAVNGTVAGTTGNGTAAQSETLSVRSGTTYTATKFVGIAASNDTDRTTSTATPQAYALSEATAAAQAGESAVTARNDAAWATQWNSDISVPGNDTLTGEIRASMFYLLESTRAGVDWSTTPGGLSSDAYNGHVFWDMETWMYPALLALHADIAESADAYRQMLLPQYEKNSANCALPGQTTTGARVAWESALTGQDGFIGPEFQCDEIHISADVALAQWQYYLATGDTAWLTHNAYPLISQIANYYASRATADSNGDGGYSINDVMAPDEYEDGVDNEAYTDASAQRALQIATEAAQTTGNTANPAWATVAAGLAQNIPFDATDQRYLEFDGYNGQTIKQADVTMLQYPWNVSMSPTVAQNDLDYYGPVTDADAPAMTASIASIDSAALAGSRCDSYSNLESSVAPYMVAPFNQFTETPNGGAFDFTTGAGGFLQEFEYGFTGLRWTDQNALQLDPNLPPQLPDLNLTGLQWHGSTYNLAITQTGTTITDTSGLALPVQVADGATQTVAAGDSLTVPTRVPNGSTDAARCKPVTASSQNANYPAEGAVDGSRATSWQAASAGANLTVDLGTSTPLDQAQVTSVSSTTAYSIEGSNDDATWTSLGTQAATSTPTTTTTLPAASYRYVRYQAAAGSTPQISDFSVTPQSRTIQLASQGLCVDDRGGAGQSQDPAQVYTCNDTGAQQWTFYPDGAIRGLGLCLDVQGGATSNGTPVRLYDCNGTGAQQWQPQANGQIVNPQSGKCLDDTGGGGSGTSLQIWDCYAGDANQIWTVPGAQGEVVGYQGMCLDDRDTLTKDGNPVQVSGCSGAAAQQWTVESDGTLQALGKCLDVGGGATTNGSTVDLFTCNNTGAQDWVPQPNGELVNPQSGKCLDDPAFGPSGTGLIIYDCNGGANQYWRLP